MQDSEVSLQRPLSFASHGEQYFANKLSLNLLQDRLACASQLSLKGVIATNLVVNFGQNRKKFRHGKSSPAITGFFHLLHQDLGPSLIWLEETASTATLSRVVYRV